MSVVRFVDIVNDLHTLKFKEPTKNGAGGTVVYVSTKVNQPLIVQFENDPTLACTAPFGITSFDKSGNPCRKNLELTAHDPELAKFVVAFDDHILATAIANKDQWFKYLRKEITEKTVKDMYHPIITIDSEGKYPPRIHTKINVPNPNPALGQGFHTPANICVYHEDDNTYSIGSENDVPKNCKVMAIAQFKGIWFQTHQFGGTWEITHLMAKQEQKNDFPFLVTGPTPKKRKLENDEEKPVSADLATSSVPFPTQATNVLAASSFAASSSSLLFGGTTKI